MDTHDLLEENARLRAELLSYRRQAGRWAGAARLIQQGRDAANEAARLRRLAAGLSMELQAALTALRVGDDARYLEVSDGE